MAALGLEEDNQKPTLHVDDDVNETHSLD